MSRRLTIAIACCLLWPPGSAYSLTLVQNGEPRTVILIDDEPGDEVEQAVDEVNYWVGRITGAELEVVAYSEWDGARPVVAVGTSPFTVEHGITQESLNQQLGPEGAKVVIEADHAILAAPQRDYYAATEFAKHALEVRWIWPGETGEVFEPRQTLVVEPAQWAWDTRLPDMRQLRIGRYSMEDSTRSVLEEHLGEEYVKQVWDGVWAQTVQEHDAWVRRQRVDVHRVDVGHAFSHWWDEYSETHPEWFAARPGGKRPTTGGRATKLCVSNPEVAANVVREWDEHHRPHGRDLRISPNDSRNFCVCEDCRAWDAPEMQGLSDREISNSDHAILTDRYVRFWNRVAELAVEIDPDVRVTTYAYRSYEHPPLTDIQVHPNVYVGMVTGEGYYPDEPVRDYWREWAEAGANLFWRPNLLHAGHGMPYVFPKALGKDVKFFHERNMVGVDFDSLNGHWGTQSINYYVAAEMISRPEADVEQVLNEYYQAFGYAAEPVRQYFEYMAQVTRQGPEILREHDLVRNHTWGGWWPAFVELAPLLFTEDVFERGEHYLQRAEDLADGDREVVQKRVALMKAGFDHSRRTVRAIRSAITARDSTDSAVEHHAIQNQAELLEFRRELFKQHPLAVNATYLMDKENRRNLMWYVPLDRYTDQLHTTFIPLDRDWMLKLDPEGVGLREDWHEHANKGVAGWEPVEVGMPWRRSVRRADDSDVVWYRLQFDAPMHDTAGERVFVRFGSIDAEATIWLNGQEITHRDYPHEGDHDSWREPFELEITAHVNQQAANVLVARVQSEQDNGGITGLVTLVIAE